MKRKFVLLVCLLTTMLIADDGQIVEVKGVGITLEEAKIDATKNAVVQVVGQMVDVNEMTNNEDIDIQILAYSNGFVETLEVVKVVPPKDSGDLYTVDVKATVLREKIQKKVTAAMETSSNVSGESLFAEMLTRTSTLEQAAQVFEAVFSGYRPERFLHAGVAKTSDGKPAIELDPDTRNVTLPINIWGDENLFNAWVVESQRRIGRVAMNFTQVANNGDNRNRYREEPNRGVTIGNMQYTFSEDTKQTLIDALKYKIKAPHTKVTIVLLDSDGKCLRSQVLSTKDFEYIPFGNGAKGLFTMKTSKPEKKIVFGCVPMEILQATRVIKCYVGEIPREEYIKIFWGEATAIKLARKNAAMSIVSDMVEIPSGKYDYEENKEIQIPSGLYMCKYEVTQALWMSVMGNNPSDFSTVKEYEDGNKGNPRRPVECVSWNDCQEFIKRLNSLSNETGFVFRLPTDEEWEYACRAGSSGNWGLLADGTMGTIDQMGWYHSNSRSKTHPVGQKTPNAWGLYDMHGNVKEWTASGSGSSSHRIYRGGGWNDFAQYCVADSWQYRDPDRNGRGNFLGFRLAASRIEK